MKRVVVKLGLLVAGMVVALLMVEGVVRLAAPHARDHVLPSGSFVMDDSLGWRLAGGKEGRHRTRYFDVVYTSNRAGFRDRDRTLERSPQIRRVLVYGDSQVFGWGVPEVGRFTNRLEQSLPLSEVWNFGVPGYGLDQEIVSYGSLDPEVDSDLVVFLVSRLTLGRIGRGKIYKKFKPRFELGDEGLRLVPVPKGGNARTDLLYRVLSPFYLPYFLERRLALLGKRGRQESQASVGSSSWEFTELAQALVRHAVEMARARGDEPAILSHLPQPGRNELRRLCAVWDVLLLEIDLSGRDDVRFGPLDPHWTEAAHEEIARQLQAQLEEKWPEAPR
jgi:hypothetical protein